MSEYCDSFSLEKCNKCQRYTSIEVHGKKNENTMTYVNCPYGDKVFEYISSERKSVRVDKNKPLTKADICLEFAEKLKSHAFGDGKGLIHTSDIDKVLVEMEDEEWKQKV